jgi:VanZ family protein
MTGNQLINSARYVDCRAALAMTGVSVFTKISLRLVQNLLRVAATLLAVGLPLGLYFGGAQPVAVGLFPWPWGKLVHAIVFGVLAAAVGYASGLRGARMVMAGFAASVAVGALDEWHQTWLPGRHGQLSDVGFDAIGAALGASTLLARERVKAWLLKHH